MNRKIIPRNRLDREPRRGSPWGVGDLFWLLAVIAIPAASWAAELNGEVEQIVSLEIQLTLPADGGTGVAIAVRINGHTLFLNYGYADVASRRRVDSDALFNLASIGKVFDATLLAQAIR
jgi:beta-lactamase class C